MTEPVNNQWIDETLDKLYPNVDLQNRGIITVMGKPEAKAAIQSKLESIEQEAYKKGYLDGAGSVRKVLAKTILKKWQTFPKETDFTEYLHKLTRGKG